MIAVPAGLLLTDLYQLTMLQAYFREGLNDTAVFEFFVRRLPADRNFLIAAGLEPALEFLEQAAFRPEELDWLANAGRFERSFVDSLRDLRFSGDVHALPEGSVCFADEPLLRITAPLREAQLVESRLINLLHFSTLVASKAARCTLAAGGKQLVDFGLRRAHGAEAGLLAARSSFLAGFDGTATALAGALWGIPVFGTMAHSYVQVHDDEESAFEQYAGANPQAVAWLIDTYDTQAGARHAVAAALRLKQRGVRVHGVRIDSGDLAAGARGVRQALDAAGLSEVTIFASGNLDEFALADLAAAPIDAFGVGTRLDVSADAPYLDCAYKLQEYAGRPRRKLSSGKATWPGRKQVFRQFDQQGRMLRDVLALEDDAQSGRPLLQPVMLAGRRTQPARPLASMRAETIAHLADLPTPLLSLRTTASPFEVVVAPSVRQLAARLDRELESRGA